MKMTTDGKKFIYAVFTADGCECKNLDALFETIEESQSYADHIRQDPHVYGDPNLISVELLPIGVRIDCLADYEV